jgi:hypothetical protein
MGMKYYTMGEEDKGKRGAGAAFKQVNTKGGRERTRRTFYNHRVASLTSPSGHGTILASLDEVTILQAHPLNGRRDRSFVVDANASATVPVMAVGLIVDLDHIVAGGGNNTLGVKHHAGDRLFVGVGIVYGSSSEIPNLVSTVRELAFLDYSWKH